MPKIKSLLKKDLELIASGQEVAEIFRQPEFKKHLLEKVVHGVLKVIQVIVTLLKSDRNYQRIRDDHGVFDWSIIRFKRRMKPDTQYITVLRLENPHSVQLHKHLVDLSNLDHYLKHILATDRVWMPLVSLKGCKQLLNIRSDLEKQSRTNRTLLDIWRQRYEVYSQIAKVAYATRCKEVDAVAEKSVDEVMVNFPTRIDFAEKTEKIRVDSAIMYLQNKERMLREETARLRKVMQQDETIRHNKHDFYVFQMGDFREKLVYWEKKFEADLEQAIYDLNDISLKRAALQDMKISYLEHLDFFRIEIDRFRRIAKNREEQLRRRVREEEEAMRAKMAREERRNRRKQKK